jgi:alkylation response protein AidB-like acyl-CoA dehydrogenase
VIVRARAIGAACAETAAALDASGALPGRELQLLAEAGLLAAPLRRELGGLGLGTEPGGTLALLAVLREIGRGNLSVGRIYEGHVNALQLIQTFGSKQQIQAVADDLMNRQTLFGIWNSEAEDGVRLHPLSDGRHRLEGAKTFASGAGCVNRPLITGALPDGGWQLCLLSLDQADGRIDSSWWQPLGMRASGSARIDLTGIEIGPSAQIGEPGDYHQQPWLTAGAIRFAAVQVGGADALLDATRDYLRRLDRTEDPYQRARLGEMAVAVESGALWLRSAAAAVEACPRWFDPEASAVGDEIEALVAYANLVRSAAERLCLDLLEQTERAVGARGLLRPWPFERLIRDLRHYLRQPAPDAALAQAGAFVLGQAASFGSLWRHAR